MIVACTICFILSIIIIALVIESCKFNIDHYSNTRLDTIDVYRRVLSRQPTESELDQATQKLNTAGFNMSTIDHASMQSEERRRLHHIQTNITQPGLEGAISDAYVLNHVHNVYNDIHGSRADRETMAYLLMKYRQSGLDDKVLLAVVNAISISPLGGNPYGTSAIQTDPSKTGHSKVLKQAKCRVNQTEYEDPYMRYVRERNHDQISRSCKQRTSVVDPT